MLMRTDPFREFDRITQQILESNRPAAVPMDAYREGDDFVLHLDLPGVAPEGIDVEVEQNVLTVKADRPALRREGRDVVACERPSGTFTRRILLGDSLDTENIAADHADGVLTLRIPVAERSKARKIVVGRPGDRRQTAINA
ncbi:Hsp20/alpha crystallin family protein [Nocardiopsis algeriensis]|uniref:HSP20 family protein n=1 Tax=Nocardiopsis algeriensis TaxID=1478215 RepID=A0A841ILT1_9ACTN|nr:Hsp20/alpha crystallin family protein [Nocardiopsis algeriensis]MBB6119613.1 HSP20 family protein [Nocardiopsis algeriensis]